MSGLKFGLIVIGDEILSGRRQDKHLARVIELLAERGIALSGATYLGDDPPQIQAALRQAFASGDCIFSCGGIGATPDDHTRACAAAALDRPLVLHPQAAEFIHERIRQMAQEKGVVVDFDAPENLHRLNLGRFPEGATIIPNPVNRIAGFSVGHVHFVPGFPAMAHPMIGWVLDTHYRAWFGRSRAHERSVLVFEKNESDIAPLMEEVELRFAPVRAFSLPHLGDARVDRHIELGVKGLDEAQVDASMAHLRAQLDQIGASIRTSKVQNS